MDKHVVKSRFPGLAAFIVAAFAACPIPVLADEALSLGKRLKGSAFVVDDLYHFRWQSWALAAICLALAFVLLRDLSKPSKNENDENNENMVSMVRLSGVVALALGVGLFGAQVMKFGHTAEKEGSYYLETADTSESEMEQLMSGSRSHAMYGKEFLPGVSIEDLSSESTYEKHYAPTFAAIRKNGTSLLPCDKVAFDLDAKVSGEAIADGLFLTDPDNFTVTKATTVTWTENGQTGTIKDADIADIKNLPEDARVMFQPDSGETPSGTEKSVSVSNFLETYEESEQADQKTE